MTHDEIKKVRDALDSCMSVGTMFGNVKREALAILDAELAQPEPEPEPEPEPVAWQVMVDNEPMKEFSIKDMAHDWAVTQKLNGSPYRYWIRPLFTAPPAAKPWQSLTDEDKSALLRKTFQIFRAAISAPGTTGLADPNTLINLAEAALKEKNHG